MEILVTIQELVLRYFGTNTRGVAGKYRYGAQKTGAQLAKAARS